MVVVSREGEAATPASRSKGGQSPLAVQLQLANFEKQSERETKLRQRTKQILTGVFGPLPLDPF